MRRLQDSIVSRSAKVVVVGLGYVGLPLAVEFTQAGFGVTGVDVDPKRVAAIREGRSYVSDVADESLRAAVDKGLTALTDYAAVGAADVVILCVPTPLDRNRQPDVSYIEYAIDHSLPHMHPGQLVVLESTTYPGTTEEIIQARLESKGLTVGRDVYVAFSPERVDPGNDRFRTKNTPKVVGGVTSACADVAKALYESVLEGGVHVVSSPRAAEMAKLLENIFRIVNISLVNELALLCERMDIDIWEVIEAAKTKPFGFMPFYPGPGVGGHCIPLDPFYLSWKAKEYDFSTRFIELAGDISQSMPYHVVESIAETLGSSEGKALNGARVMLLGVAYKAGIGDTRESPALKIARLLARHGAKLCYHDPFVSSIDLAGERLVCTPLSVEHLMAQDIVVITTAHPQVDYGHVVEHARLVFDTRNATREICSSKVRRLGAPRESSG